MNTRRKPIHQRTLWVRPLEGDWAIIDMQIMDRQRQPLILGGTRFRWQAILVAKYLRSLLLHNAGSVAYKRIVVCNKANRVERRISLKQKKHEKQ